MPKKPKSCWRSTCPLNIALEIFGDRWTLLVLRDLLLKQLSTFRDFQQSGEGIASNILSDRLKKLIAEGVICSEKSPDDARVLHYQPTAKGLDLLPVIVELIIWADRYEETAAPPKLMRRLITDRESFIADIRARFPKVPPSAMK